MSKDLRPALKTVETNEYTHDTVMSEALENAYNSVSLEQFTDIHLVVKKDIDKDKPKFRIIVKARSLAEPNKEPSEAVKRAREIKRLEREAKKAEKELAKKAKAEEREKAKAEKEAAREAAKKEKAASEETKPKNTTKRQPKTKKPTVEKTPETPVEPQE